MKDVMNELLIAVITVCIPIITTYATKWIKEIANNAAAKTDNVKVQGYLQEITDAVATAVSCTSQTYTDSLKESGNFTADAQREAFQKSYDSAVKIISPAAAAFIAEIYGDVGEYIAQKIEAEVRKQKIEVASAIPLQEFKAEEG